MLWGTYRSLVLVFALVSLSGCLTAYRPPDENIYSCKQYEEALAVEIEAAGLSVPSGEDYSYGPLAYQNSNIEYDFDDPPKAIILRYSEGGRIVNRCDYSKALNAFIAQDNMSSIVVVYVHGWRNDSGSNDEQLYNFSENSYPRETMGGDLETFNQMLDALRKQQSLPVIGIFVSWKGGSGIPGFEALTYRNRRDGADKIGAAGGLPRLLAALSNISEHQEREDNVDNQLIYIGHSFGGRILFKAVADDLIIKTQLAHPNGENREEKFGKVDGVGDLIVLLNPAFEAASYQAIDEFRFADRLFDDDQVPKMLVFQSESDKANGMFFRFGQALTLNFNSMETQNIGFRGAYWTNELVRTESGGCSEVVVMKEERSPEHVVKRYNGFCYEGMVLKELPEIKHGNGSGLTDVSDRTPFMVVRVEKEVLNGHSWHESEGAAAFEDSSSFASWLFEYIF